MNLAFFYNYDKVILLFPANVMGNTGELSSKLEPNFTKIMVSDLRFRPKFVDHAQDILRGVKAEHLEKLERKKRGKKKAKRKDFVFVGIHCRRTDHLSYERDQVRGGKLTRG